MGEIIGFGTLENERTKLIQNVRNNRSDIKELVIKEIEKNYEIIKRYLIKESNLENNLKCPETCRDFERKRLNSLIEEYEHKMKNSEENILNILFPNDENIDDIDCLYLKGHWVPA